MSERIDAQIRFLREADRLKSVNRANLLLDATRSENAAEHSWHVSLFALICAPFAGPDVDLSRAIQMLVLHDLVEIDSGDHPIHLETDWNAVAASEQAAANRLFALLPEDQAADLHALRDDFEADRTPTAQFAKDMDRMQPVFQVLLADAAPSEHTKIARDNLIGGRAKTVEHRNPDLYRAATALLDGRGLTDCDLGKRLSFLTEADALKHVNRASKLADLSRFENSAEHSWHIMLYAWILAEYAGQDVRIDRVLAMLLIHDIVEIDAGDNPIHGQVDVAAQTAKEEAAALRLFGLLPDEQGAALHSLWHEFEAAESTDAIYAKAIDRIQVPVVNLVNGGGTWADYEVTYPQIEARVGRPVNRGTPVLWAWLAPKLEAFLTA